MIAAKTLQHTFYPLLSIFRVACGFLIAAKAFAHTLTHTHTHIHSHTLPVARCCPARGVPICLCGMTIFFLLRFDDEGTRGVCVCVGGVGP